MTERSAALEVAIIGSGFGGLAMAWHLKQAGIASFVILEKAHDVGGVWRENTYPGAACDVASHLYSFSFAQRYPWKHRFSEQPQILEYLRHCVREFGLESHLRFGAEVVAAEFDSARDLWTLRLADGQSLEAKAVISAVGQLHRPSIPKIAGLDGFAGKVFHSARWDHNYDLTNKSVAVIGTGSSAAQFVPEIAKQVAQLHVFQRSPGWVFPRLQWAYTGLEHWLFRSFPGLATLDRHRVHWFLEWMAGGFRGRTWVARMVSFSLRAVIWLQVRDRELRQKLTPNYPPGCKRSLVSSTWLPTLARPNVEVVTEGIERITTDSVVTTDGRARPVDAIIFGTGFTATQFLAPMRVTGVAGEELQTKWQQGAAAYLGMAIPGFPNFFVMYGPNTNIGAGSVVFMLECQARYITRLLLELAERKQTSVEVTADAHAAFAKEIQSRSALTTFVASCNGWHKTAEGRNTNNWIGPMSEYRERTERPDLGHFRMSGTLRDLVQAPPSQ